MKHAIVLLLAAGALIAGPAAVSAAATKPVTITINVGKKGVPGGPKRVTIMKGSKVVLVVKLDPSLKAEEIHLHGYDIEKEPKAGKPTRLAFAAKLSGRFALMLHLKGGHELQIGDLTVK
jgi:hypothetical protein